MMSFAVILMGESPNEGGVSCGCRLETGMGPLCLARQFQSPRNTANRVCFSFNCPRMAASSALHQLAASLQVSGGSMSTAFLQVDPRKAWGEVSTCITQALGYAEKARRRK